MHTACSLSHMRGLCLGVYPGGLCPGGLCPGRSVQRVKYKNPKLIQNLSQIQPSLPTSQSLKYYKNQNRHIYFFLYYLYLSQIYPKFNLLSLYLTHSNSVNIPNLSQIQPSLPTSQSLKYHKNQNKHTYFFLYYLYLSQIYPKFNLLSLDLTHSNSVKIPNLSQIYPKFILNSTSYWC